MSRLLSMFQLLRIYHGTWPAQRRMSRLYKRNDTGQIHEENREKIIACRCARPSARNSMSVISAITPKSPGNACQAVPAYSQKKNAERNVIRQNLSKAGHIFCQEVGKV